MRRWGGIGAAVAFLAWTGCASVPPSPGEPSSSGGLAETTRCVGRIRFIGNAHLTEGQIEPELFTQEAPLFPWADCVPFEEITFQADLDRVRERYREEGYFDVEVVGPVVAPVGRNRVDLEVTVVEGAPVLLTTREIELVAGSLLGADELDAIVATLPARLGEPFGRIAYDRTREALMEAIGAQGFLDPELKGGADVDVEAHTAALAWQLSPGPRVRVGEITIDGPDSIDEQLLVHRLPLEPGELLTPAGLEAARKAMVGLGIFRSVKIGPERLPASGPEVSWPIHVGLELGSERRIRLGAGYGTEEGPRGLASWSHRNWLGNLRRLKLSLAASSIEQIARVSLLQPSFPDLDTDLELTLGFGEEDPPAWRSQRAEASIELRRPLAEGWRGAVGLRLSEDQLRDFPEDPTVFDEEETPRVGALTAALRWAALDDALNPTRGQQLSIQADVASQALLSDTDFVKLVARARGYVPLGPVVLTGRIAYGAIATYASTGQKDIPVVERFFAGGSASVRGFDYQELPPDDPDGDPLGGLSWLEGSVEVRVPVWREIEGVAFLDAGVIDVRSWSLDFDDILYSAGVGARYVTPVGSLRLDVGFPLNRPHGVNRFRIHFSVGHGF